MGKAILGVIVLLVGIVIFANFDTILGGIVSIIGIIIIGGGAIAIVIAVCAFIFKLFFSDSDF